MEVIEMPKVGEQLDTSIDVIEQVMELTLVNATIKVGDRQIASAEMKIALAEEVKG
jgi:hypothetical protein